MHLLFYFFITFISGVNHICNPQLLKNRSSEANQIGTFLYTGTEPVISAFSSSESNLAGMVLV